MPIKIVVSQDGIQKGEIIIDDESEGAIISVPLHEFDLAKDAPSYIEVVARRTDLPEPTSEEKANADFARRLMCELADVMPRDAYDKLLLDFVGIKVERAGQKDDETPETRT